MKTAPRAVFLLALTLMACPRTEVVAQTPTPAKLRALLVTGGGDHDWQTTTPFLPRLLVDSGRFDVRVTELPDGLTPKALAQFDLVVDDNPRLTMAVRQALADFVASGKGLVLTHAGLAGPGDAKDLGWSILTGAAAPNDASGSGAPFHRIMVKTATPDHPIMKGVSSPLSTGDRPGRGLFPRVGFSQVAPPVVLATDAENADPLLWAREAGPGRVFCTTLGYDLGAMQETAFITTFLRGAEWAGSGAVTLPARIPFHTANTNGVRLLVITGGHDHEAAFYGLFEGYKDIRSVAVADSNVFERDLRTNYDVAVFYNFTRNLDDAVRTHLEEFVGDHKGIVVLHHGILNFQNSPWWYEDVVGGLYRLETRNGIPNSTVKFGQEHFITAAGEHPITAGLCPFHVTDETYKGLFISPKVKPLLLTDNPTSDPVVGWIGPCTTARVVFFQLGHDHVPFTHPAYRALVHNAILWSAGKLD